MASSLNNIIPEIHRKENAISLSAPNAIDKAYQMVIYLQEYLWSIREDITQGIGTAPRTKRKIPNLITYCP